MIVGPLMRKFSANLAASATALFTGPSLSPIIPPPSFETLPKLGLWRGMYESFHDFAIVTYK
jgi:hypothetical protein